MLKMKSVYLCLCAIPLNVYAESSQVEKNLTDQLLDEFQTCDSYHHSPSPPSDNTSLPVRDNILSEIKFLKQPKMTYPEDLKRLGNKGKVALCVQVDSQGRIIKIITTLSDHPLLEQEAVKALLDTQFKALGQSFFITVPMHFDIRKTFVSFQDYVEPYKIPRASKKLPEDLQYDKPPEVKVVMPVVYPLDSLKKNQKGDAKIFIMIGPDGLVHQSKIISASSKDFGYAAQASFASWQFYPALKDNKPSWAVLTQDIKFNNGNRDTALSSSSRDILKLIQKNTVFTELKELDKMPTLRYSPLPKHVSKQEANQVVIEFYIDTNGFVQLPNIIQSSHPEQAWQAVTAIKRWQFDVPKKNGQPTIVKLRQSFNF